MLLTVHDELMISAPKKEMREAMQFLKDCMESVEFDVPMLSEGKVSAKCWTELETYDKKGEILYGRKT